MMITDESLAEFISALSSASAVPGGGGAAALAGAMGAGLGIMVGCLTIGKKKYAEKEEQMKALMERAETIKSRLFELVDGDAAAFEPLSRAYSLPKDAPDRDAIMEKCLVDAASVPMEILELGCGAIELMAGFAEFGNTLAISDAGCGAALCRAAVECAALNVLINTRLMKDRAAAEEMNRVVAERLKNHIASAQKIYDIVYGRLL